jgi:hypothetical protein
MAVNTRMPYYMLLYYCYGMRYRDVLLSTLVDSLSMSLTHFLLGRSRGPQATLDGIATRTTRTTGAKAITAPLASKASSVVGTASPAPDRQQDDGAYASSAEALAVLALLSVALHAVLAGPLLAAALPRPLAPAGASLAGLLREGALLSPAAAALAAFALAPLPPWPAARDGPEPESSPPPPPPSSSSGPARRRTAAREGATVAAAAAAAATAAPRRPPGVVARGAVLAAATALDVTARAVVSVEGVGPRAVLAWAGAFAGVTLAASAVLAWVVAGAAEEPPAGGPGLRGRAPGVARVRASDLGTGRQ